MSYDKTKNVGSFIKSGKFEFGVYQATLDELGCDIKVGDYIGILVNPTHREYYTITNDGRNNFDNQHMIFGYRPAFRNCVAAHVDPSEMKDL